MNCYEFTIRMDLCESKEFVQGIVRGTARRCAALRGSVSSGASSDGVWQCARQCERIMWDCVQQCAW
jgi:hypothetical protein